MQDSNLRPLGPKPSALPSCANHRHIVKNTCVLNGCGYYLVARCASNTFYKKKFVRSLLQHLGQNNSHIVSKKEITAKIIANCLLNSFHYSLVLFSTNTYFNVRK